MQYVARLHTPRKEVKAHQTSFYGNTVFKSWVPALLAPEPAGSWIDVFLITDWYKDTEVFQCRYTKGEDGKVYETLTEIADGTPGAAGARQESGSQTDARKE